MTSFQERIRPLLAQFNNATGRGNLIVANSTLATILESMALAIDRCNVQPPADEEAPAVRRGRGRPRKQP